MAANKTQIGGYECDWVEDPPDDIKCQICLLVARNPQQHGGINKGCGKIFCTSCITEHQKNSQDCPNCRRLLNVFDDVRSIRHINALKVKCSNLSAGCKWIGELSYLEEHLTTCDYTLLPCNNKCLENSQMVKIFRKDLKDHLTNHCPRRQYECPHCKEKGEHQERTTTHLGTCPQVKIHCPNKNCSDLIPRCEVIQHRSTSCQYEPVSCKYAAVGCKETPLRKDIQEHESDNQLHIRADQFLELAKKNAYLVVTTNELTKQNADLAKTATKLTKENVDLANKTTELTAKNASLTKITTELTKKNANLEKKLDELVQVTQSKPQSIFRLGNFQQHKRASDIFYSPPFYTSPRGYKLRIMVYANGYDDGEGTHVSVFTSLMKGEHDNSLTWPLLGTVTVELLNQQEDKNHFEKKTDFLNNEYSQRVMKGEGGEIGWGEPKFFSHTSLKHDPIKNCQYLKDDSLVFRVTVSDPNYKPWLE